MAVADWNNLTTITREKILPGIVDAITKTHPLLQRFWDKAVRLDGGNTIDVNVKYRISTTGGSYAGLESLDTGAEDTRTRASWQWKQYHKPIVLSNIDIAKNGGTDKIAALLATELEDVKSDYQDMFANDLFASYQNGTTGLTGNNGKKMDSLIGAVDDGTNVALYGNITRTGNPWWQSTLKTTAANLSLAGMASVVSAISDGQEMPDLIVTTVAGLDAYEGLLTASMQYQTNVASPANTGNAGFQGYTFRGIKIVSDRYCPAGSMFFLNTKYIKFYTLKHPLYATTKEGFAMSDLRRPDTQDGQLGYIFWYGNLVNTAPRRQGRWTGILNA